MTRADPTDFDLVEQARAGDPVMRDAIACMVQQRVYPYLRRVTLNQHKAEDLTQDTVVAVLKSLGTFRQPERFWSWVFAIASNLLRQQARDQARHRVTSMSTVDEAQLASWHDGDEGLVETSRRELAELTNKAMDRISERYRMVLNLRFYEDLPHAEVARVMGCSEFNARALFCRAKLKLARELKQLGVGRKAVVPALAAFGAMTLHPASAPAVTVTISSGAAADGLFTTLLTAKAKAVVLGVLLLSAAGTWAMFNGHGAVGSGPAPAGHPTAAMTGGSAPQPADLSPLYIHTICHGRALGARAGLRELFEAWFYLPQGPDGPRMKRCVPVEPADRERVDWSIETAETNYHYFAAQGEMHITNERVFCTENHTAILPTDSAEFCAFVQAMDGEMSHAMIDKTDFVFERDPRTGFVVGALDNRPKPGPPYRSIVEYNPAMQTDPIAYAPPSGMTVIDDRDAMHKRGWTWFRVSGRFGQQPVTGVGQVPFTYAASRSRPQWLRLKIGDQFTLTDDGRQALVQDSAGATRVTLPGGSFLKGMCRPWEGFHTIDSIRRDAAAVRCRYTTDPGEQPIVVIHLLRDNDPAASAYPSGADFVIDTDADLLRSARYWQQTELHPVCELNFTYLQTLEGTGEEFAVPEAGEQAPNAVLFNGTPLWPLELLGSLTLN